MHRDIYSYKPSAGLYTVTILCSEKHLLLIEVSEYLQFQLNNLVSVGSHPNNEKQGIMSRICFKSDSSGQQLDSSTTSNDLESIQRSQNAPSGCVMRAAVVGTVPEEGQARQTLHETHQPQKAPRCAKLPKKQNLTHLVKGSVDGELVPAEASVIRETRCSLTTIPVH